MMINIWYPEPVREHARARAPLRKLLLTGLRLEERKKRDEMDAEPAGVEHVSHRDLRQRGSERDREGGERQREGKGEREGEREGGRERERERERESQSDTCCAMCAAMNFGFSRTVRMASAARMICFSASSG